MQVYIVINESLYHDSSYNDIVGAFETFEGARCAIETCKQDWMLGLDWGYFKDDFTFKNLNIVEEEYYVEIEDKVTHFFEKWHIEPVTVQK